MPVKRPEAGFTLIEVAMVALLLALMSGILYGTLRSLKNTKAQIEARRTSTRTAQYVLQRMTRELTNRLEQELAQNDPSAPKVRFLGKNEKIGEADADSIRFMSLGSGQVVYEGSTNFGAVEIEYRLSEAGEDDLITTDAAENQLVLVRSEVPAVDNKDIREKRRIVFPLSERISSLNFRYRRSGKWLDEWSEKRQGIPDAVEITIGITGANKSIEKFRTAVSLKRE